MIKKYILKKLNAISIKECREKQKKIRTEKEKFENYYKTAHNNNVKYKARIQKAIDMLASGERKDKVLKVLEGRGD